MNYKNKSYLSEFVLLEVENAVTGRSVVRLRRVGDGHEAEGVVVHVRKLNLL